MKKQILTTEAVFPTESEAKEWGFPLQAQSRGEPWQFVGWIKKMVPGRPESFEKLCQRAGQSDHGETREVEIFPEGAVVWYKEKGK
jgi:hypothetical protein